MLAPHRARSPFVRQRTATIRALRGLMGEYGIIAAKGVRQRAVLSERLAMANVAVDRAGSAAVAQGGTNSDQCS